jgi:hypothetical protein
MISVLLFLLVSYADPASAANIKPERLATFGFEVGRGLSRTAILFRACAQTRLIDQMMDVEAKTLWETIQKLNDGETEWAGAGPAVLLVALARYSYMFRSPDVAQKWVGRRFTGLPSGTERELVEARRFEMATDRDTLFMPLMEEACKIDKTFKTLLKPVQETFDRVMKA